MLKASTQPDEMVHHSERTTPDGSTLCYRVTLCEVDGERSAYRFTVELHSGVREVEAIDDVTSDASRAARLFRLLSENAVYPCHLRDVVEDFLASDE